MVPGKLCMHRGDCYHTTLLDFRLKKPRKRGLGPHMGQRGVSRYVEGQGLKPVQPEKQVACISGITYSLSRWLRFVLLENWSHVERS